MFAIVVTTPDEEFALMGINMQRSTAEMADEFVRVVTPINNALLTELHQQPGAPKYPLRWASQRQRRYVMAKLRAEGNLPYNRTGAMAAGWSGTVAATTAGGAATVENSFPEVFYVEGAGQQPYHADTGWIYAPDAIARYGTLAADAIVEAWFTASDPFTGVPQT